MILTIRELFIHSWYTVRYNGTSYLCGDVCVGLPVAVTEVSVDVVCAHGAVKGQERHAGVVVRDYISVTILRLVNIEVTVVPRELLARVDRLEN